MWGGEGHQQRRRDSSGGKAVIFCSMFASLSLSFSIVSSVVPLPLFISLPDHSFLLSFVCVFHTQEVNPSGSLLICWDPLDGSSIIDCNWSVASIFGIWQTGQNGIEWRGAETLINATGQLCRHTRMQL